MKSFEVQVALEGVAEARKEWERARRKFDADVEYVMNRLINEAAVHHYSADWIAQHAGMTVKRIRIIMRSQGLDPKRAKRLLSRKASEALAENSALLGIEPHEMDLTSPLAYLPMGSALRKFLETPGVTELEEDGDDLATAEKLLKKMLFLRQYGEHAPGHMPGEDWRTLDTEAEEFLRRGDDL